MKKITFLIIVFVPFISFYAQKNPSIKILSSKEDKIRLSIPINDIKIWDMNFVELTSDTNSIFKYSSNKSKIQSINIVINENLWVKTLLIPNLQSYLVYENGEYHFKGQSADLLNFYKNWKKPFYNMSEFHKYKTIESPSIIKNKFKNLKVKELEQLIAIPITTKTDQKVFDAIHREIDYYYAQKTLDFIQYKRVYKPTINDSLIDLFHQTLKKYPLEDGSFKTADWAEYATVVLLGLPVYYQIEKDELSNDLYKAKRLDDTYHTYNYEIISSFKEMKIKEKVLAYYLASAANQQKKEKSIITLFERFKLKFPTSKYLNALEFYITPIKQFHSSFEEKTEAEIKIIESENINTWEDLMSKMPSNKYYVDIWATWCGPCIEQFQFNNELNNVLKEKNYKKLYISVDKESNSAKWQESILRFNLNDGSYHIRVNKKFISDFKKRFTISKQQMQIPQYLLVNTQGKIINNNAPRPKFFNELSEMLK